MENIINWFKQHHVQIAWFTIGMLTFDVLLKFIVENWSGAMFSLLLIAINYYLVQPSR
jgi:hypothetical protein